MPVRLFAAALAICVAPLAARAADDENPYKNVKVGDFSTYKLNVKVAGMDITGNITQSVTAKSEKEAAIKVTGKMMIMGNAIDIPVQEQKIDLTMPFDPTKLGGPLQGGNNNAKLEKVKDGKEKLKVNGKEYETTWTTYKLKVKAGGQDIESDLKVWMAKDAPMGMIKMTMIGDIGGQKMDMSMEMTETGNKK